jgi:hypothetical protein
MFTAGRGRGADPGPPVPPRYAGGGQAGVRAGGQQGVDARGSGIGYGPVISFPSLYTCAR